MSRTLENAPLEVAIAVFSFDDEGEWDWTVPGSFYEKIREDFPEKWQLFDYRAPSGEERESSDDSEAGPPKALDRAPSGMRFGSPEDSRFIEVRPDRFRFEERVPYPGWDTFKKDMIHYLEQYREIYEGGEALRRISLRYINAIPIEGIHLIDDVITTTPNLPGSLDRPLQNLFQQYDLEFEQPKGTLRHRTGFMETPESDKAMVDLQFTKLRDEHSIKGNDWFGWLDDAHEQIYTCFEDSVTDSRFDSFKG